MLDGRFCRGYRKRNGLEGGLPWYKDVGVWSMLLFVAAMVYLTIKNFR